MGLEHPPNSLCAPSPRLTAFSHAGVNAIPAAGPLEKPDLIRRSLTVHSCVSHIHLLSLHVFFPLPGTHQGHWLKGQGAALLQGTLISQACTAPSPPEKVCVRGGSSECSITACHNKALLASLTDQSFIRAYSTVSPYLGKPLLVNGLELAF